jgi:hypothetical protein
MKRKEIIRQKRHAKRARTENNVTTKDYFSEESGTADINSEIWNFGKRTWRCRHCDALLWYEERLNSNKQTKNPSFGICCKNGKVSLPAQEEPPAYLERLLNGDDKVSKKFRENIRSYNSMFAFTSTGGIVDKSINNGHAPYVFRMHGQNYHHIGTLLPEEGTKPRWAQLYIYDTEHEVSNRISSAKCSGEQSSVAPKIVEGLKNMLDDNNVLAKTFRMARDRFKEEDFNDVTLKLIGKRNRSGTHGLPSASEVAALVVRNADEECVGRDIIVEYKNMVPQRISEIHPKFMSLQYPLLYPYGEDGFTLEIPYKCEGDKEYKRKYVSMLDYYSYFLHHRPGQSMLLLNSGRLSLQYWVDVYTCIEQNRLNWIRHNQGKLRTELYSGLQDALDRGDTRTEMVGKRIYLPSTHTGSPRYMAQNLQDAMAICRWIGYPNLFVTFTCNSKWPEIQNMIDELNKKQKPADRAEVVVRVFMIKLKQLLRDISKGIIFGETVAG